MLSFSAHQRYFLFSKATEVIISKTVFQEFLAIFEPESPQDMRPEKHLIAATSLLQKKEDTIANAICD
jgi:hypothetical protein